MKKLVEIEVPDGEGCTFLGTSIFNSASCFWKDKDGWCNIYKKQLSKGSDGVFFTKLPECLDLKEPK